MQAQAMNTSPQNYHVSEVPGLRLQASERPNRSTLPRFRTKAEADQVRAEQEAARPDVAEIIARYCSITMLAKESVVKVVYDAPRGQYVIHLDHAKCTSGRSLGPVEIVTCRYTNRERYKAKCDWTYLPAVVLCDHFTLSQLAFAEGGAGE